MADGEGRMMVLIGLISNTVQMCVATASLRKGSETSAEIPRIGFERPQDLPVCGIIRSSVEQVFAADPKESY